MHFEAVCCPVCGSNQIGPLAVRDGYGFDACAGCGFAFLNPRPGQAQLNDLYRAEQRAPEPTFDKATSRMRRAWLKLPRLLPYALRKDVLDLGCGGGFMTHVLGTVAHSATGVDINANASTMRGAVSSGSAFFAAICMNSWTFPTPLILFIHPK